MQMPCENRWHINNNTTTQVLCLQSVELLSLTTGMLQQKWKPAIDPTNRN